MNYFLDTSAFVKYYHQETGSDKVQAIFNARDRKIWVSDLGVLEAQSAFAMRVRSGQTEQYNATRQRAAMMLDIATGNIEVHAIRIEHFRAAGQLITRHSYYRRLRTLDSLQLAVAVELRHRGLLDTFVVADTLLCEIAELEGVPTLNPAT